jgi:hypothetical protein
MIKNMNKPAKSILDEAYDDARALEEALKQNAKDLLSATMKTDLEELVKESLDDDDDDTEKEDDVNVDDTTGDVDVNVDATIDDEKPEDTDDVTGDELTGDTDIDDLASDDDLDTDEPVTDIEPMDTGADVIDMTQASDEDVLQVFKKMGPEDGIVVTRDVEGNLDVNTGSDEFKIMMNEPVMGGEEGIEDLTPEDGSADETDEVIYELDLSGLEDDVNEDKLSPFDSKVSVNKKDVMNNPSPYKGSNTVTSNTDPYDSKISVNKNDVMNNASPYKGKNTVASNTAPYDQKNKVQAVSECGNTEDEMMENKPRVKSNRFRTTGNNQNAGPNTNGQRQTRGALKQEEVAHYKTLVEGLKKENHAFKTAVEDFKKKLHEVAVFNSNLAFTVRLFTENSTTKKEKINILRRFDNVKNLSESKNLFETVQKELGSSNVIKENKTIDDKVTKTPQSGVSPEKLETNKTQLFESKIYEDPMFKRSLDIMKKINK